MHKKYSRGHTFFDANINEIYEIFKKLLFKI